MHDYEPSNDYPVLLREECVGHHGLTDACMAAVDKVIGEVRRDLAPHIGFYEDSDFTVFFLEKGGLQGPLHDAVAVYITGTSSQPVVGLDLAGIRESSQAHGLNWLTQVEVSLVHELAHAYQESIGLDAHDDDALDEDAAEGFARTWVDHRQIDLALLGVDESQGVERP